MTHSSSYSDKATRTIPAAASRRQIGFDVARALAVFGMVIVNFKVVMGAETAEPDWLAWIVGLFDGRAAATFVTLAGVGLSLLSRSARMRKDGAALMQKRKTLLKRAAFLFGFGLLFAPVWPADILHFYGIYMLIGVLMLNSRDRHIWSAAVAFILGFVLLLFFFDYDKGWEWETLTYLDFWTLDGMLRHLFFNGFHPVMPWAAFLLVGIWLGRQELNDRGIRRKILTGGLVVTVAAEIASKVSTRWMLSAFPHEDPVDIIGLFGTAPIPPMPFYMLSAGGTALVVIVACIILTERFKQADWLLSPLVVTGQFAFTLYVAHVVIGMGVIEALGRIESGDLTQAVIFAFCFYAGGMAFTLFWRRHFARGPMEWLVRKLTG